MTAVRFQRHGDVHAVTFAWPGKVRQKSTSRREGEIKEDSEHDDTPSTAPRTFLSHSGSCGLCGQELLHPSSVERGVCARCHPIASEQASKEEGAR